MRAPCSRRSPTPTTKARSEIRATRCISAPSPRSPSVTIRPVASSRWIARLPTSSISRSTRAVLQRDPRRRHGDPVRHQPDGDWSDDAAQQMKITVDSRVLLCLVNACNASNRGAAAGKISANINLGVTGTPVPMVANRPTRRSRVRSPSSRSSCAWASCSTSRTSPNRDAGSSARVVRRDDQGVGTPAGLFDGRRDHHPAQRAAGHHRPLHPLRSNLLPKGAITDGGEDGLQALAAGEWVMYAGHAHGFTFATDLQGRDAALRVYVRNAAARLAGLRPQGHRRYRAVAGVVSEPVPV